MTIKLLSILLLCLTHSALAESVNFAPPFQIYQKDPQLGELLPSNGNSSLCWPSSLAHRMFYFQKYYNHPLSNLNLRTKSQSLDIKSAVQTFVNACHTDIDHGTKQSEKVACITDYFEQHGYHPKVFSIGKASRGVSASSGSHNEYRQIQISDLRKYISQNYGVILHVGWMKYDSRKHTWVESGSHSLNAYGYDYDPSWGEDKIVLKVVNPLIDYSKRDTSEYYDSVTVSALERKPGEIYPEMVGYSIRGPGFNRTDKQPMLEDLFLFSP